MVAARGYLENATFYERLIEDQSVKIAKLGFELNALRDSFNDAMDSGEIEEGSEAWYDMSAAIHDVEEAIADANIEMVKYRNTLRELSWSYFDYAQQQFSQLTDEANFLIQLMSSQKLFEDNGQFNDTGMATVGMHAMNYDVYMAQADEYAKEIRKIDRELASDQYNTELIERRQTLLGLQQQSILTAESEKSAVQDLVANGIQLELQALQELIDAYNENLDSAKDLYDYQKRIKAQTEDVAKLEKQISAYQGDTSEENRARVQQLQQQLKEARTNLQESEYEKSVADQKQILSDLYDEYEELLNKRLDDISALMREMIDMTNENMFAINTEIRNVSRTVGYEATNQMINAISGYYFYYDRVFENISRVSIVLDSIYENVSAMARASGAIRSYASGGPVDYTGLASVHGTKSNPEYMLSNEQLKRLQDVMQGVASNPLEAILGSSPIPVSGISSGSGGISVDNISVVVNNPRDYDDFLRQMQKDNNFERLIHAMTDERYTGRSRKLDKNRIQFR